MKAQPLHDNSAVIVDGIRTPFVRAFQDYRNFDTIELGRRTVEALLKRNGIQNEVEAIYWGAVLLPSTTPNIAREIALETALKPTVESLTVTRACSSSLMSVTQAAAAIERGEFDVALAGGSESVSNAEVPLPQKLIRTFAPLVMNSKSGPLDYLSALAQLAPFNDLLPKMPRVAERSTGELMGEAAENMCRRAGITREAQDELAYKSHVASSKAFESGRFDDEIFPMEIKPGHTVYRDQIVRGNIEYKKLSQLRPAFRRRGTITAGNASALTDGAAATLLMSYKKARELGLKPRARFLSWHYSGVDPRDQLLIGPAISMPIALERAGLSMKDIDMVEIHEAFAGQVLCVLKAMASEEFVKFYAGDKAKASEVNPAFLNKYGGSVALGHPFGATGARIVNTAAN
ncbi:MAG TPA: acetyl-CoA C-acyltransferase, partial [Turneriella sp.]|nr:acetyl-CoA C-acyltransferase [Turneriella sp.]